MLPVGFPFHQFNLDLVEDHLLQTDCCKFNHRIKLIILTLKTTICSKVYPYLKKYIEHVF